MMERKVLGSKSRPSFFPHCQKKVGQERVSFIWRNQVNVHFFLFQPEKACNQVYITQCLFHCVLDLMAIYELLGIMFVISIKLSSNSGGTSFSSDGGQSVSS
jgi:hypothetical protein